MAKALTSNGGGWHSKWWVWVTIVVVLGVVTVGILFGVGVLKFTKDKPVGETFRMTGEPSTTSSGAVFGTTGTFSNSNGVYTASTTSFDLPVGANGTDVSVSAVIWTKVQENVKDGRYRMDVDFGQLISGEKVHFWSVSSSEGDNVSALNADLVLTQPYITNGVQTLVPAINVKGGQVLMSLMRWGTSTTLTGAGLDVAQKLGVQSSIPTSGFSLPVKSVNFVAI
jgi:hypothetical protein